MNRFSNSVVPMQPGVQKLDESFLDDDSTFTFRTNSKLKEEFALLCKHERFSASAALKRYMAACVRADQILK